MIENINLDGASVSAELHALMYDFVYGYNGVFNYGQKLASETISNNEIRIKDGLLCNQGRFMRIVTGSYESITIENGTSGVTRKDLIVAHFETDGILETHDIRVIKGSNNGSIPTHVVGDTFKGSTINEMPLYLVTIEDLTITSVEPLFSLINSIEDNNKNVNDINERVKYIENNGVSVGDTLPIEAQFLFDGPEEDLPEGYEKIDPPFSNPNLLINSDFRNPVNQRGKTSYWKPNSWTYNVDRWSHIWNSVILNSGYIRIYNDTGETGTTYFKQIFEHPLEQNDYTVTVNVKEITGTVQVIGFGTLIKGINVFTVKNTSLSQLQLNLVGESSIELYYIKLEQGAIATPFVPRQYGEELALCQRYYQIGQVKGTQYINSADKQLLTSFRITEMRAKPTVTYEKFDEFAIVDQSVVAVDCRTLLYSVVKESTIGMYRYGMTWTADAEIY